QDMGIKFLSVLILRCEEPARIAKFYRDALGLPLEKRGQNEFACMFGAIRFTIHGLQPGQSQTGNAEIGFHIPDLDKFVKGLVQKKVEIKVPITDYPWARAATILDPLGNTVYLMQVTEDSLEFIKGQVAKDFCL